MCGPRWSGPETIRLHELLRDEGVSGIALEERAQYLHRRRHGLDELGLVGVAPVGLGDEEVRRLEARLEPNVALPPE